MDESLLADLERTKLWGGLFLVKTRSKLRSTLEDPGLSLQPKVLVLVEALLRVERLLKE